MCECVSSAHFPPDNVFRETAVDTTYVLLQSWPRISFDLLHSLQAPVGDKHPASFAVIGQHLRTVGRKKIETQHLRSGYRQCTKKCEFNSLCCTGRARAWGCCLEQRRGGAPGLSGGCKTARCSLELFYSGNLKRKLVLINDPLISLADGWW